MNHHGTGRLSARLIGYGRNPPHPRWPGGARIAVQFVLNYEEGGENCILHGDAASEAFLSEIVGAQAWPGLRHMNMESIYEYGSRAGFWRLWRLFTERGMPLTVYGVAMALARNPEAVAAMQRGRTGRSPATACSWIDYQDFAEDAERAHISEAIRIHTRGHRRARPLGWYTGPRQPNTLELVVEEAASSTLPTPMPTTCPTGSRRPHGPQLIVPYTLDANDMRFATPQGFNAGDQFFAYLKDASTCSTPRARRGAPKMMSVGLHCRLVGRPGAPRRWRASSTMCKATSGSGSPRLDIARHWVATHPPAGGYVPSRMPRALFAERFGAAMPRP